MMKITCPSFEAEKILWKENKIIIGIDEVGRGAFAGPIVAAAVIFSPNTNPKDFDFIPKINDSKLLKFSERRYLAQQIKKHCLSFSISQVEVPVINKDGIGKANQKVFRNVIAKIMLNIKELESEPFLFVDGFHVKFVKDLGLKNQKAIIKGDQKSISIAAASIIAKDFRDNLMLSLSNEYPDYFWGQNKGYGTRKHQEAIKRIGISKLHRRDFVKAFV